MMMKDFENPHFSFFISSFCKTSTSGKGKDFLSIIVCICQNISVGWRRGGGSVLATHQIGCYTILNTSVDSWGLPIHLLRVICIFLFGDFLRHPGADQTKDTALCGYPHVKVSIRDLSQTVTTASIFQLSHYFRQKYLEIASWAVSL